MASRPLVALLALGVVAVANLSVLLRFTGLYNSAGRDEAAAAAAANAPIFLKQPSPPSYLSLVTKDTPPKYFNSHCTLSTLNPLDDWKTAICSYVNLCYDPVAKSFVLHVEEESEEEEEFNEVGVNVGGGTRLGPLVVRRSPLPVPRYESDKDQVWILAAKLYSDDTSMEHFLRDSLFAWWLLAANSLWQDTTSARVWLLGEEHRLTPAQREWYGLLFGGGGARAAADVHSLRHPMCFPRSAAGVGSMTDHCMAANEDHLLHEEKNPPLGVTVASIPCSVGRMSLFGEMRERIVQQVSSSTSTTSTAPVLDVLFLDDAQDMAHLAAALKQRHPEWIIERRSSSSSSNTASSQVYLALSVARVLVTRPAGPLTALAHFLRPGTGVVLLDDNHSNHNHNHGRENFAYWNHVGYIRPRWVDSSSLVLAAIELEADKSAAFRV